MVSAPAVQILEEHRGDVTVLRLRGSVNDTGTMVRLAQQLVASHIEAGHIVLDVDGLTVEDPAALCALLARLGAATAGRPVPTAVSDPALRRLLRTCGAGPAGLVCFASVEAAAEVARHPTTSS